MNQKFLKNLKLVCKYRHMNYDIWLKAYKLMPREVQKRFQLDLLKDVKQIKQDITQRQTLDKAIQKPLSSK